MKIAIVGGSPSSANLAPFEDESYEIWVHGNQMNRYQGKRVSRIFEIHDDLSEHGDVHKYSSWLASLGIPMTVGRGFPIEAQHIDRFPFYKAEEMLQGKLTSTPAYMMALAILQGATHIAIYGVDMAVDDHEYFLQRPAMYAWIGYAKALGIDIYIPPESSLFVDRHQEGVGSGGKPDLQVAPFTAAQFLAVAGMHAQQIADAQSQIDALTARIHAHTGARQAYERLAKVARAVGSGQDIKTLTETIRMIGT